ncbi:MAG: DUF6745 domain-containing protein [Hyphomicrobiaceae bacterium]
MRTNSAGGLSAAEAEQLASCRSRWEALRTCTLPADRTTAEAGVIQAYRSGGLVPPDEVVWCAGPVELSRRRTDDLKNNRAGQNIRAQLVAAPLRQVDRALRDAVSSSILFQVRLVSTPFLVSPVSRSVVGAVAADAEFGLVRRAPLRQFVDWLTRRRLTSRGDQSLTEAGLSQHDAPPYFVYDFFSSAYGLGALIEPVQGLMQIASSVGWFVPHEKVCYLAERHDVLRLDPEGRLHATDGPALGYPDQWFRYFWKGVELSPWMIEQPDWIDLTRNEREPDPVIRHCLVDIMTPERFIRSGYACRVAADETGTLWQRSWRFGGIWAAVEVVNGTPEPDGTKKHYFLTVPGNLRSARQAVAWTYGLNEWEYEALKLRT